MTIKVIEVTFVCVCVCVPACARVCASVQATELCVCVRLYRLLNVFLGCFRMRKRNVLSPMVVNISVYKGHMNQGFSEEAALATVVTERWYLAPGVQRVDIREQGVKGTLFIPPGTISLTVTLSHSGLSLHGFVCAYFLHLFLCVFQARGSFLQSWTCGEGEGGWWSTGPPSWHHMALLLWRWNTSLRIKSGRWILRPDTLRCVFYCLRHSPACNLSPKFP